MANHPHQERASNNSWAVYGQLALGMVIFGSGTPISKILTDAFPVFVASSWVCNRLCRSVADLARTRPYAFQTLDYEL